VGPTEPVSTGAISTPGLSIPYRGTIPAIQLFETLCYKPKVRAFDTRWGHLNFFIGLIFPAALWIWDHSACNRNEYQGYLLGCGG